MPTPSKVPLVSDTPSNYEDGASAVAESERKWLRTKREVPEPFVGDGRRTFRTVPSSSALKRGAYLWRTGIGAIQAPPRDEAQTAA